MILVWRWWWRWLVHWLISSLSSPFTPVGGLLFLPPVFLGPLTAFDYFVDLADDILPVCQEASVFVNRRVPRRHFRPIDVRDVWEGNKTLAVRSINQLYRPVPLKLCLAALGAFDDLGGLVGIGMHVRAGIAHKRRCSRLVGVGKSGRFRDVPGKVYDERNKGISSTTRSHKKQCPTQNTKGITRPGPEVTHK